MRAILCILPLFIYVASSISTADKIPFLAWYAEMRDTGWNVTADPCTWAGINCTAQGDLYSIDISPEALSTFVWGSLPPVEQWAQQKQSGSAFRSLTFIRFNNLRFGPFLPDWVESYWTRPGSSIADVSNNPHGINVEIHTTTSVLCPLPASFDLSLARARNVSCTNLNIITISPDHGPSAGGSLVYIKLNVAMTYRNMTCSFGTEDKQTLPVPVKEIYFADYLWADYANATFGVIPYSVSVAVCEAPPHPPGTVNLTLWSDNTYLNKDFPTYYSYECPAGYYGAANSPICDPCPGGFWSPVASETCYPCPAGTYAEGTGNPQCTPCEAGYFGNVTISNSSETCYECLPGYYTPLPGATECVACPSGTAQPDSAAATCDTCKPGSYAEGVANTECLKCPRGTYSQTETAGKCINCPFAEYSSRNGSSVCTKCQPGTTTSKVGSTECDIRCPVGFYRSADISRCIECPPGRFANSTGLAICQLCPLSTFNPYYNATECIPCNNGTITQSLGSISCFTPNYDPPTDNTPGLIIGIVCLIVALILVALAIGYIFYKKHQQRKKQHEIDEIRKIMDGVK